MDSIFHPLTVLTLGSTLNRAVAVGRLMLGEFDNWLDFLHADILDLENLPRRNLKSGSADVKNRLSSEIKNFCAQNFRGMDEKKLSELYTGPLCQDHKSTKTKTEGT